MSVVAIHHRPRIARLRVAPEPVTVTISVASVGTPEGERVLAALRDLVAAAGSVEFVPAPGPARATEIRLDPLSRIAVRNGRQLELSRLEFDLLLFFARNRHQVFTRSQLLLQVWGHKHTTNRTVDVHVSRLRAKLGEPEVIATVYGVGYRFAEDAAIAVLGD